MKDRLRVFFGKVRGVEPDARVGLPTVQTFQNYPFPFFVEAEEDAGDFLDGGHQGLGGTGRMEHRQPVGDRLEKGFGILPFPLARMPRHPAAAATRKKSAKEKGTGKFFYCCTKPPS
jgi:hypothetical protein